MYKYKLKEIEVGDVETQKGQKTTVTDIDPRTGGITWSVEDVAAFDTAYKSFDKIRRFLKKLSVAGESKDDTKIDSISDQMNSLFNEFRTHVRKNYPDQYKRIKRLKEGDEEGEKDVQTIEKLLKKINNKKEWGELINKLVSLEVPTLTGMGKKAHLLAITKQLKEDLSIKGKKVKRINKNNSTNPEDYTVEYEDGTSEPYVDTLEESVNEGFFQKFVDNTVLGGILGMMWYTTIGTILDDTKAKLMADKIDSDPNLAKKLKTAIGIGGKNLKEFLGTVYYMTFGNRNLEESVNEGTFHGPREIAIYDGPDGETYIEKRGLGYYGYNNSFDFEAEDKAELKHKLNSWGYRLVAGSIDEGEGEGYLTPKAFDKNKKSTGASDIYYYKLGYKPVPKKIKGSGLEVKQLFEKEELTEYSDFQQKRISTFDEVEEKLNLLSPLLSNAKSDTAEFYNENPGSYAIVYSTDMISELLDDITDLLKQQE